MRTAIPPEAAILRRKQVAARTGLSAGTIRKLILIGEFPAPFQLTGFRSVGWLERDVAQWIEERAARVPLAHSEALRSGVPA